MPGVPHCSPFPSRLGRKSRDASNSSDSGKKPCLLPPRRFGDDSIAVQEALPQRAFGGGAHSPRARTPRGKARPSSPRTPARRASASRSAGPLAAVPHNTCSGEGSYVPARRQLRTRMPGMVRPGRGAPVRPGRGAHGRGATGRGDRATRAATQRRNARLTAFWRHAHRRQNSHSSATRETTPANPGRPGHPIAMARSLAGRLKHRAARAATKRRNARSTAFWPQ